MTCFELKPFVLSNSDVTIINVIKTLKMNILDADFALLGETGRNNSRNGGKFNVITLWVAGIEFTEKVARL